MEEVIDKNEVSIRTDNITLKGNLAIPDSASGLVVFVHGSGSSRLSPRNQDVARHLNRGGLATLLFDLLTVEEHVIDLQNQEYRFNIGMLSHRLTGVLDWLAKQSETASLIKGLFGASTGAAAALIAAAQRPRQVSAVVSRGGRPDLAGDALGKVIAPTLLIVGALDEQVIHLNRVAGEAMINEPRLEIVPGASHLFEERGKPAAVSDLSRDWFIKHLVA